jgi:hypothetical protein
MDELNQIILKLCALCIILYEVNYTMNQLLHTWLCAPVHTSITTPTRFGTYCDIIRESQHFQSILNTSKMIHYNVIYAEFHMTRSCESSCVCCVVKIYSICLFKST